jgi:hypothetical protein
VGDRPVLLGRQIKNILPQSFIKAPSARQTCGGGEHNPVTISALNSARHVWINLPEDIDSIQAAGEGITLWRPGITKEQKAQAETGKSIIIERTNSNIPHQAIQDEVWRYKEPTDKKDDVAKALMVDYHTAPEGKELRGRFGRTAAGVYDFKTNVFRFDDLEHDPAAAQTACDFLTHFHSDHANAGALERMYQKGLESTVR